MGTTLKIFALCCVLLNAATVQANTVDELRGSDLSMLQQAPTVVAGHFVGDGDTTERQIDTVLPDGERYRATQYTAVEGFEVLETIDGKAAPARVDVYFIGYGKPLAYTLPAVGARVVLGLQKRIEGPGYVASYQRFMDAAGDKQLEAIRIYAHAVRRGRPRPLTSYNEDREGFENTPALHREHMEDADPAATVQRAQVGATPHAAVAGPRAPAAERAPTDAHADLQARSGGAQSTHADARVVSWLELLLPACAAVALLTWVQRARRKSRAI